MITGSRVLEIKVETAPVNVVAVGEVLQVEAIRDAIR